jgi:hypothetical protein
MKQTRYFEWIAGEDIGEICVLSHVEEEDGHLYLHFTNGDVCDIYFDNFVCDRNFFFIVLSF